MQDGKASRRKGRQTPPADTFLSKGGDECGFDGTDEGHSSTTDPSGQLLSGAGVRYQWD